VLILSLNEIIRNAAIKKRKFVESIDIQITLHGKYSPLSRRIRVSHVLPYLGHPKRKIAVLALEHEFIEYSTLYDIPIITINQLQALNRDRKLVKHLGNQYDAFLCSSNLIRRIPRLLGPGLNKLGKFPDAVDPDDDLLQKVIQLKRTIHLSCGKTIHASAAVGNVNQPMPHIVENILSTLNAFANGLDSGEKRGWYRIKQVVLKSTMGPPHLIYSPLLRSSLGSSIGSFKSQGPGRVSASGFSLGVRTKKSIKRLPKVRRPRWRRLNKNRTHKLNKKNYRSSNK